MWLNFSAWTSPAIIAIFKCPLNIPDLQYIKVVNSGMLILNVCVVMQEDNQSSKSNSVASQHSIHSSSEVSSSSMNSLPGVSSEDDPPTTFHRPGRRVRLLHSHLSSRFIFLQRMFLTIPYSISIYTENSFAFCATKFSTPETCGLFNYSRFRNPSFTMSFQNLQWKYCCLGVYVIRTELMKAFMFYAEPGLK